MSSKFLSVLAGVALAASVTSAFAFEAVLSSTRAVHTHPWHRSAVVGVLPAGATINILAERGGWSEVAGPNGLVGFVRTPLLVSAAPAAWGPGALAAPFGAAEAVVATPFNLVGGVFAPAPAPAPVVASY
ncbi:MAG: SH3 domain-containing protein [Methylocystis sp.]